MLEFVKGIAEENNLVVSEEVINRAAIIMSSPTHRRFFFDSSEEGLSPWVNSIVTLINTCKQQGYNLYLTSTGAYPVNSVTSAIDTATDKVRQDGGEIQVYKVTDNTMTLFATVTQEGTKYED